MPAPLVDRVEEVSDMSRSRVEELWEKAKERAEDEGMGDDWGYIVGIFKQSLGKKIMRKLKKQFGWEWPKRWHASIISTVVQENIQSSVIDKNN